MAGSMSGSMYANTSTNAYRFILYWTITNQGISGSTAYSDVTFTFKGRRLNTSYNSYNGNSSYSFSIDGTTNASGSLNFDSRSWANNGTEYTLWSSPVVVRINHSSAGSKTAALSFTLTTGTSGAGTVTVSGNAVLQDIAMAGTLSLGSSTLTISNSTGPTQTFTIGQYQSAYNYKVEWKIGSTLVATTTIPANNTTTRSQVLGASTWGPKMTSTSSTTVTAILYTYSGNTQIGSTSSATFTLKYTIAPTLSSASASMSTSCRSYTQNLRSYYYKGQSAVVITANSFSGSNGSTLSSYTFYMNGSAVSTQTTTSWTSGTLNTVGTVSFTVRATDTRGNYVEKSTSISVVDYAAPKITAKNAYRVSSGSTADSSGTKIYYTATAAATGTGNSIKTLSVMTEPAATSSTASVSNTTTMSGTLNGVFSITSAYTVVFEAVDAMGYSSGRVTALVQTAKRIINVTENKDGVGFGMFGESGLASFNMPIKEYMGEAPILYTSAAGISTMSALNNVILSEFNSMSTYSVKHIIINPQASFAPFNGGITEFEIYKTTANYGAVKAMTYSSAPGANASYASIYGGSITGWHGGVIQTSSTSSFSPTTANTWEYVSGVLLTAPTTGMYAVSAMASYNNAMPTGVAIITRESGSSYYDWAAITDASSTGLTSKGTIQFLRTSCVHYLVAGGNAIVYAKYASASSGNNIILRMKAIT